MRTIVRKLRDVYCRLPQQYDLLVSMAIISGLLFAMVLLWQPGVEQPSERPSVNVSEPSSPDPALGPTEPNPRFTEDLP